MAVHQNVFGFMAMALLAIGCSSAKPGSHSLLLADATSDPQIMQMAAGSKLRVNTQRMGQTVRGGVVLPANTTMIFLRMEAVDRVANICQLAYAAEVTTRMIPHGSTLTIGETPPIERVSPRAAYWNEHVIEVTSDTGKRLHLICPTSVQNEGFSARTRYTIFPRQLLDFDFEPAPIIPIVYEQEAGDFAE